MHQQARGIPSSDFLRAAPSLPRCVCVCARERFLGGCVGGAPSLEGRARLRGVWKEACYLHVFGLPFGFLQLLV